MNIPYYQPNMFCQSGYIATNLSLSCLSLLLFLMPLLLGCEKVTDTESPARLVKTIQVGKSSSFHNRHFPGRAQASNEVTIAFEVAGRLLERPVNMGDKVKTGQLLAKLDPRDFSSALAKARAMKIQASALRDRMAQAVRDGAVSQQNFTDAQARLDAADAQLDIADKALEDSVIKAPFAGEVAAVYVENFENIQAKQPVLRLLDNRQIEMVVNIPETLISSVPYVNMVWVGFDAFPGREIEAQIKEIGSEASASTRTYPVTLIMDQPEDITILPGMAGKTLRAEGQLPTNASNRIVIPVAALFTQTQTDKSFVWVIDKSTDTVAQREVSIGSLSDEGIFIQQGLQAGEWIVVAGVNYLQDGQPVRINND